VDDQASTLAVSLNKVVAVLVDPTSKFLRTSAKVSLLELCRLVLEAFLTAWPTLRWHRFSLVVVLVVVDKFLKEFLPTLAALVVVPTLARVAVACLPDLDQEVVARTSRLEPLQPRKELLALSPYKP
jgi:hypothetical protein